VWVYVGVCVYVGGCLSVGVRVCRWCLSVGGELGGCEQKFEQQTTKKVKERKFSPDLQETVIFFQIVLNFPNH